MTDKPDESGKGWRGNRREFFRATLRLGALGALGALGYSLLGRNNGDGNNAADGQKLRDYCVSDGICPNCTAISTCGLPQALSVKAARNKDIPQ